MDREIKPCKPELLNCAKDVYNSMYQIMTLHGCDTAGDGLNILCYLMTTIIKEYVVEDNYKETLQMIYHTLDVNTRGLNGYNPKENIPD